MGVERARRGGGFILHEVRHFCCWYTTSYVAGSGFGFGAQANPNLHNSDLNPSRLAIQAAVAFSIYYISLNCYRKRYLRLNSTNNVHTTLAAATVPFFPRYFAAIIRFKSNLRLVTNDKNARRRFFLRSSNSTLSSSIRNTISVLFFFSAA
ncbi:hypothetical protein U1Q18_043500, partial [Sarracenia purpurea var. burkii]